MTAYEWKTPGLYRVDPNTAGRYLDAIYRETGRIEPSEVVERSRDVASPLHGCFEWDDSKAAQKWREQQARVLIANVMVVGEPTEHVYTRAFVHVEQEYQPISIVLESKDKTSELLRNALRELRTFEAKYRELTQLVPVFKAIRIVTDDEAA